MLPSWLHFGCLSMVEMSVAPLWAVFPRAQHISNSFPFMSSLLLSFGCNYIFLSTQFSFSYLSLQNIIWFCHWETKRHRSWLHTSVCMNWLSDRVASSWQTCKWVIWLVTEYGMVCSLCSNVWTEVLAVMFALDAVTQSSALQSLKLKHTSGNWCYLT